MASVTIKSGGKEPGGDGDVNLYESKELKDKSWFDRDRRVIFINGMKNNPDEHADSAEALSTLQACPVIGVYNQSDGFLKDVWQCLKDKLTLAPAVSQNGKKFAGYSKNFDQAYQVAKKKRPSLTKAEFVRPAIAGNKATAVMFDIVRDPALLKWPIFAHSQGNLISCNALASAALAGGVEAIRGRKIHSFGSPNLNWPPGITHFNHAFTFDFVSMMDYRFSLSSIKVGGVIAHSFDEYRKYDPEFVINRFRWGSFGFTLSLDEEGLADALVEMGANSPRLKKIFERLRDAHNSDADDVTLLYVQKMRKAGREPQLRIMAQEDPPLIDLLVHCLSGGKLSWVTGEEKQAAEFLRGLK